MSSGIDEIISILEECKTKKIAAIDTEKILEYAYLLKNSERKQDKEYQKKIELTKYQAQWDLYNESHKAEHESNLEMFRSV
jgi:hypothetical protein